MHSKICGYIAPDQANCQRLPCLRSLQNKSYALKDDVTWNHPLQAPLLVNPTLVLSSPYPPPLPPPPEKKCNNPHLGDLCGGEATGAIVGIAIGGFIGLMCFCFCFYVCCVNLRARHSSVSDADQAWALANYATTIQGVPPEKKYTRNTPYLVTGGVGLPGSKASGMAGPGMGVNGMQQPPDYWDAQPPGSLPNYGGPNVHNYSFPPMVGGSPNSGYGLMNDAKMNGVGAGLYGGQAGFGLVNDAAQAGGQGGYGLANEVGRSPGGLSPQGGYGLASEVGQAGGRPGYGLASEVDQPGSRPPGGFGLGSEVAQAGARPGGYGLGSELNNNNNNNNSFPSQSPPYGAMGGAAPSGSFGLQSK
eukprot:gene29432-5780_t